KYGAVSLAENRVALRRLDEGDHLLNAEMIGQFALDSWAGDKPCRIDLQQALAAEKAKEGSQGSNLAMNRALLLPSLVEHRHELANGEVVYVSNVDLAPLPFLVGRCDVIVE